MTPTTRELASDIIAPEIWTDPLSLRISHLTRYLYEDLVRDSYNEAKLCPIHDVMQTCQNFHLEVNPSASIKTYPDSYNNVVHYIDIIEPHQELSVLALSEIQTYPDKRGSIPLDCPMSKLTCLPDLEDHFTYLQSSPYVSLGNEIWKASMDAIPEHPITDIWQATLSFGHFIYQNFTYTPMSTNVNTKPEEVLQLRRGVCQDFAHLMLGMCRTRGIPARYVSGYFYNPDKIEGEIEASHAWMEVYLPNFGWQGYDPTHDRVPDTRYVKIAVGADYNDIRPISGYFRGLGTREMIVEVHVERQ